MLTPNREKYTEKIPDVELFLEDEEILAEVGDILISSNASFGDVLVALTEHARLYVDETYTPQMIIEELSQYV